MSDTSPPAGHADSPPSPQQGEQSSRRRKEKLKRSKDGCFSCRSRKKKCDFVRPTCASCERLGLACQWPVMGRDDKGRLVVVNRPPKRVKLNQAEDVHAAAADDRDGCREAVSEHSAGSQASGSHTGRGQWPTRSTSPPPPPKQPSTSSATAAVTAGRPIAGMQMEDWAMSLGQLGLVVHPPPAADSPLTGDQAPRSVAQETDDLLNFLLPQYQRSVQAAHGGSNEPAGDRAPGQERATPNANTDAFLRAAMYPPSTTAPHLPHSAFQPFDGHNRSLNHATRDAAGASSSSRSTQPIAPPGQSTLAPSPSAPMSPWLEEALGSSSPRTFAHSLSMAGFSPSLAQAAQNGTHGQHDLANFSANDWLVSTPRTDPMSAARTPAVGVSPLAAILSQPSPGANALGGFDVDAFIGSNGGGRRPATLPPSPPPAPQPARQHQPPESSRLRRPGDSPKNPIVPPLPSSSSRKRTADGAALDYADASTDAAFDVAADGTFDFDFGGLDGEGESDDGGADVDGEISRASIDGQRSDGLGGISPSIGPSLAIPLPELPAFIATQAPLLIDYFLRKLAPLVSVLTPDPQSVSALSMAVSAGAALRGGIQGAPSGILGGTGAVERRAGNDLASCFLPMALESDSLLVGIVAWSAMHLSDVGQPWREIAERMTKDASSRADKAFREWEAGSSLAVGADADREAEKLLGTLILLSEVEICRGSTEHWYSPLMMAQKVLQRLGGSKGLSRLSWNGKWLMQNFLYHELTSSELPLNGPFFDEETYKAVLEGGLNTFMGSTMPIFQILSDIARLSPSLSSVLADTSEDDEPRKRIDSLLGLSSQIALLEARLDACYPTFHASEGKGTAPYHFAAFRTYGLTARLYLKQIVLHSNARSIANQTLVAQLLEAIKAVQPTPFESSLLFPIFIAGVDCVTVRDRAAIQAHFEGLHSSCRIGNIQTAYLLLQEIWARNEGGDRWVNWASLARELGWNVSFA